MIPRLACCVSAFALVAGVAAAETPDPDMLNLSAGVYEVTGFGQHDNDTAAEGRVDLRFGAKAFGSGATWRGLGPMVGMMATADGAFMPYAGFYGDIHVGQIVVQPSIGVGAYFMGDSKDLGGVLEFTSSLLVAYRFENASQLGIAYAHTSNANLHTRNPGADSLLLTYSIPVGRLLF